MVQKLQVVKILLKNKEKQGGVQAFLQGPSIFQVTLPIQMPRSPKLRHCRNCRTSNSLFQMADIVKAEEILPDSKREHRMWHSAFKKPGADTPGKRDDLDYDIGNMEATDNHQVNMEVGLILISQT